VNSVPFATACFSATSSISSRFSFKIAELVSALLIIHAIPDFIAAIGIWVDITIFWRTHSFLATEALDIEFVAAFIGGVFIFIVLLAAFSIVHTLFHFITSGSIWLCFTVFRWGLTC
jgi:hypothetical protein